MAASLDGRHAGCGGRGRAFRVWIVWTEGWQPQCWRDVPPRCVAVEPAEHALLSSEQAAAYLEGFNGTMLARRRPLWAVAVPVDVRYEGDICPGQSLARGESPAGFSAAGACGGVRPVDPSSRRRPATSLS